MKILTIVFVLLVVVPSFLDARFDTLREVGAYVQTLPPEPDSENDDWVDPDFSEFFRALEPGFFKSLLIRFKLADLPFDVTRVKEPLLAMIRAGKHPIKERPYIKEIAVEEGTRIAFFGDLHSALFSFVRCLEELEKEGLIDNNFELRGASTYIVILGDVINRSVYSFQLLELILKLMARNPERVIYLRGHQETFSYWKSFFAMRVPLKRWQLFWGSGDLIKTPLDEELDTFFDSLPDALRIKLIKGGDEKIYCAHDPVAQELLQEPGVQVMIAGDFVQNLHGVPTGLNFMGFDAGVAEWLMLSSPIKIYQKFYSFFNDSFAILSVDGSLSSSILTHFYRDIRSKEGFKKKRYRAALGYELTEENGQSEFCVIPLCSTLVLTGPISAIGRSCARGIQAAAMYLNSKGGVNGCFLKPVLYDDFYDPIATNNNIEKLKKEWRTDFLVAPVGSPTLSSYLDQVIAGKLSVFFPLTGGPQFRLPTLDHLIHSRRSYADEVRCLIEHITHNYGSRRFAIVYQNDSFGQPLMETAREELKKRGLKDLVEVPFSRDQISFKDEAQKVRSGNPEAVALFFGSSTLAQNFLGELGATFPIGKHLFATSIMDDESFRFFLQQRGVKFTFSYIVPDPLGDTTLVKGYKMAMDRLNYVYDSNSLEGYLAGMLVGDAIAHTKPPFTGERLMAHFTTFKDYSFEGLSLTFNPETRSLTLPIWIKTEKGTWASCGGRQ